MAVTDAAYGKLLALLEALDKPTLDTLRSAMRELVTLRERALALVAVAQDLGLWEGPIEESPTEALLAVRDCLRSAARQVREALPTWGEVMRRRDADESGDDIITVRRAAEMELAYWTARLTTILAAKDARIRKLEAELAQLIERNSALSADVRALKSAPRT